MVQREIPSGSGVEEGEVKCKHSSRVNSELEDRIRVGEGSFNENTEAELGFWIQGARYTFSN